MLGRTEAVLWRRLERLEQEVQELAQALGIMEGRLRARLKEEAAWALSEEDKVREADKIARSLR